MRIDYYYCEQTGHVQIRELNEQGDSYHRYVIDPKDIVKLNDALGDPSILNEPKGKTVPEIIAAWDLL